MADDRKITNEEYRKTVLGSNERQMALFYKMAQLDSISYLTVVDEMIHKENIYDRIKDDREKNILLGSHQTLLNAFSDHNKGQGKKEKGLEKLQEIRQDLYNLYWGIDAYEVEISYLSEEINHHMMMLSAREMYKDRKLAQREVDGIIDIIYEELGERKENHSLYINLVGQVLAILPFRMAKLKYFDIIEKGLKRNLHYHPIAYVEDKIAGYKLTFDSSLSGDYGIIFDHVFTNLQKYKNIDIREKSYEELEDLLDNMDILWADIDNIQRFIYLLGVLANKLIGIYLLEDFQAGEFKNDDILEMWWQYENKPNDELLEDLDQKIKRKLVLIDSYFQKEMDLLEGLDDRINEIDKEIEDEIAKEFLSNRKAINYLGDRDFQDIKLIKSLETKAIAKDYLDQLIDSLIRYIDRSLNQMGGRERRIRMRRLLATIELPFADAEEFLGHISYSLDERVVNKDEILFTLDALYYMFDKEE